MARSGVTTNTAGSPSVTEPAATAMDNSGSGAAIGPLTAAATRSDSRLPSRVHTPAPHGRFASSAIVRSALPAGVMAISHMMLPSTRLALVTEPPATVKAESRMEVWVLRIGSLKRVRNSSAAAPSWASGISSNVAVSGTVPARCTLTS